MGSDHNLQMGKQDSIKHLQDQKLDLEKILNILKEMD